MLDITKFLPLNSADQVDKLISHLKKYTPDRLENAEGEILMEIGKVKVQFYFKEQFEKILGLPRPILRVRKFPKVLQEEFSGLENLGSLKGSFKGYTVDEVALQLGRPSAQIIKFLAHQKIKADGATILNEKMANVLKKYAQNIMELNERKEKMSEREAKLMRVGNGILEEKFKPSRGKEGNYAKLIYTRPKS